MSIVSSILQRGIWLQQLHTVKNDILDLSRQIDVALAAGPAHQTMIALVEASVELDFALKHLDEAHERILHRLP